MDLARLQYLLEQRSHKHVEIHEASNGFDMVIAGEHEFTVRKYGGRKPYHLHGANTGIGGTGDHEYEDRFDSCTPRVVWEFVAVYFNLEP